ncbi:helix-turn-helix transcriptional regulator [Amycolatopsis umgeniensis]|uniref:DNA-binding protein n=1 Tax=Amycolatopsis umgeniensis TaxID=336628 RepID=A0A841B0L1_9PSEU|nr:hypothetical protein [Amycolatopsis umgeniensis]MBB5852613.1 hypothetical protein [Amycolatopsis umgeniensis]
MGQFELIFAVGALSDETVLRIHQGHDVFTASYGGLTMLTVTTDGDEPMDVARKVVASLEEISGVHVDRCCEDLMSLSDIADRSDVAEDTVREWMVEGAEAGSPFPKPYYLVGGGVWLWSEVNDWLREVGKKSSPVRHLSRLDILQTNLWLAQRSRTT